MTAPTPIPDAAVEAYIQAHDDVWARRAPITQGEAVGVAWDAKRAGLAAALPHLPAAPSGETAPQPCGHTIAGVLGRLLMCSRPAGHDGAHGDASGAQWAEVPPGEEVAAASVPAAPNADVTPADTMKLVRQYGRHLRNAALFEATGSHQPAAERRARAEYVLDLIRVELERPAAAPSGEQPTGPAAELAALRQTIDDLDDYGPVNGQLVHEVCDTIIGPLGDLGAMCFRAHDHVCPPAAEQPTTEPAGEVDRG